MFDRLVQMMRFDEDFLQILNFSVNLNQLNSQIIKLLIKLANMNLITLIRNI
jgi:hypothetical protein